MVNNYGHHIYEHTYYLALNAEMFYKTNEIKKKKKKKRKKRLFLMDSGFNT